MTKGVRRAVERGVSREEPGAGHAGVCAECGAHRGGAGGDGDERIRARGGAGVQGAGVGVRRVRPVVCVAAGVDAAEQAVRALGDVARDDGERHEEAHRRVSSEDHI